MKKFYIIFCQYESLLANGGCKHVFLTPLNCDGIGFFESLIVSVFYRLDSRLDFIRLDSDSKLNCRL